MCFHTLTHEGRVTHICVSKLTIIGSDNGLSPDRRQAIIWTNAGILLIVGIDHVFASGAVVGRATTHEWGRPSLRAQRGAGRPHESWRKNVVNFHSTTII